MTSLLQELQKKIEKEITSAIPRMGEESRLRDACAYAMLNGGKRIRPSFVLLIARALDPTIDFLPAALGVEYLHAASLIADDLPCMDNDDTRRDRPAVHKVFGESIALLASYTLVAAGYGSIYETNQFLKEKSPQSSGKIDANTVKTLDIITQNAGLRGATYGQYLDLFPPNDQYETIRCIIERKTATLFEVAFLLGWLFGGGAEEKIDVVRKGAKHFGMFFQMADDCLDFLQDGQLPGKINAAQILGFSRAKEKVEEEFKQFISCFQELGLWTQEMQTYIAELSAITEM